MKNLRTGYGKSIQVCKIAIIYLFCMLIFHQIMAQSDQRVISMKQLINEEFQFAAQQYKVLLQNTPLDKMPRTYINGKVMTSGIDWWTSGFVPGSLWYIYEQTGDTAIKSAAEKRLIQEEKVKRYTGNHDIGFMIFCSFGNAFRITGEAKYKDIIDTAAVYQSTRYRPAIHAIQSWNTSNKFQCPVIIDNMMNLEQLCWVTAHGGDKKYMQIAIQHANTTLLNHFREDYSSYHVVDYDINNGSVLKKGTHQGLADSSAWARGQSWALYGYTMMYRYTKDKKYLAQANHIAAFILQHTDLPEDKIPYWDYNAPVNENTLRDASAASVMASALLELGQYVKGDLKKLYVKTAEKILRTLSSEVYRSKLGENGGFILKHSVGSLPGNSEVDLPLTYADYYFLEALKRFKDWYL